MLLISGGAGFVGLNFLHHWCARHASERVVVLDALTYASRREGLSSLEQSGQVTLIHGDVADLDAVNRVFADHDITRVLHLAAESHVDRSIAGPAAFVRTNVVGTQVLLDAARAAWQRNGVWRDGVRFHHVSTDEVFGPLDANAAPVTESAPYRPSSPYAASKAAADHLVRSWGYTFGLPYVMTHCANNYGPWQHAEKLMPLMITRALAGESLPVYGDGLQRREWLHVTDHARMLTGLLNSPSAHGSYNLAGNYECSNLEVVHTLCAAIDAAFAADLTLAERYPNCPAARGVACISLVLHVTDRLGHDRRYALNGNRLQTEMGMQATTTFELGVSDTVRWYLNSERR
ncbi:MAG: dTDP-glucose 4,6-dehydratase [Gemmatimonadaceae bacterium]|nr:dTDP-glucose 4,6-dehydratase [Gemmatimonadaceae bacterium]